MRQRKIYGTFAFVGLVLMGCSRNAPKSATVALHLPAGSISSLSSVGGLTVSGGWGVSDPSAIDDIDCYAILIEGPEANLRGRNCVDTSNVTVISPGIIAGLYAPGSNIEIEVPSGSQRRIAVVGFDASVVSACVDFRSTGGPVRASLSTPQIIGEKTVDLSPGRNEVTITVSLAAREIENCSGLGTGTISGGGTSPAVTVSDLSIGEGTAGTILLSLSAPATGGEEIVYTSIAGTALGGVDFTVLSGTVTFAASQQTATLTINSLDDASYEGTESFTVTFVAGVGLTMADLSATVTIFDDEPPSNYWAATTTTGAPSVRTQNSAVWTGSKMIIWGGAHIGKYDDGGMYDPVTDVWTATSTISVPLARMGHRAVWTGTEMIIWGGIEASATNSGRLYNPVTDTWTVVSATGAPVARFDHTAIWTGSKMIIWGGYDSSALNSGGLYDPVANTWSPVSLPAAPTARQYHKVVWTGTEMLVWGGFDGTARLNSGAKYNPTTDTWTPMTTTGAPSPRSQHSATWLGSKMLVWGGVDSANYDNGALYDPVADTWTSISSTFAPSARYEHFALWTGSAVIIWGGMGGSSLNTGGLYFP